MSLYRPGLPFVSPKPGGNVVIAQTPGLEPVLEGSAGAVVWEHAAIPKSFERRDLIVSGPATGVEREARIRADGGYKNRVSAQVFLRKANPSTGISLLFVYSGGV